jgi:hypothetical protein
MTILVQILKSMPELKRGSGLSVETRRSVRVPPRRIN